MSAEDNKQTTKDGYAAFSSGDAEGAMAMLSDSIQWVVGGSHSFSGTIEGKEKLGEFWAALGNLGFEVETKDFIADGDKVVVIAENRAGGRSATTADVLTFDADGKVARFENFGEDDLLDEAFG